MVLSCVKTARQNNAQVGRSMSAMSSANKTKADYYIKEKRMIYLNELASEVEKSPVVHILLL